MTFYRSVVLLFLGVAFIGCGADEETAYELDSDKTPVVTLEKVPIDDDTENREYVVAFKVVSDIAPKNDLLVSIVDAEWVYHEHEDHRYRFANYTGWATIPKGKKSSRVYEREVYRYSVSYVYIHALPTVSIVGEGEVIDQESLEKHWNRYTLDEQKIPEGFRFPVYEVGDIPTSDRHEIGERQALLLYQPGPAKIIGVDPPNGSLIIDQISANAYPHLKSEITVTFDRPPFCPILRDHWGDTEAVGTTFTVAAPWSGRLSTHLRFTVTWGVWGDTVIGAAGSETFEYSVATAPW